MKRQNIISLSKGQLLIILSILIILSTSIIKKGKILIIEDKANGVYNEFYLKDGTFKLSYTHSVHKTNFEEFFYVRDDNTLLLQKNIFDSFGVGSPYIDDFNNFKIENNKFVLYLNRSFREINMVISPIPEHKLTIGDREIQIIDLISHKTNTINVYSLEKYVIAIGEKFIIL